MLIEVFRKIYTARTTSGRLFIDGEFFCYTLEDTVRPYGIKVAKETAIPAGDYKLNVTMSSRFQRLMVGISTDGNYTINKNGISFKGGRFHGGNDHANTEGCILIAKNRLSSDSIQGTMEDPFCALISKAIKAGDIPTLVIRNHGQAQ